MPYVTEDGNEVYTADEIKAEEVAQQGSPSTNAILSLARNPGQIQSAFNLTETQTRNVKSLLIGATTGGSVKYLGRHIGDEVAAIIGAGGAALLAKKIFGP